MPGAAPPPKPRQTPLQVITYEGVPMGMVTAEPKHEIPDASASYLQDILVDLPGITRRRGPLSGVSGMVAFTNPIFGAVTCYNPAGALQIGVLEGTAGSGFLSALSANLAAKTQLAWVTGFNTAPYPIVDAHGRLSGGALIGVSTQYDEASPTQSLGVWRGATKPVYSTGTATTAINSPTITGIGTAWLANASPGHFVFVGGLFTGVVKSVNSDTSITLENNSLLGVTGSAYALEPLRGLNPWVVTGEISCGTAAATVTGANTKFVQQGLGTGTWDIFRLSDFHFVGTVTSVTNDTSLTLTANAAIALSEERYAAIRRDGDWGMSTSASNKVGFLTAVYANRQWYANLGQAGKSSYLWFSEQNLPDAIDTSPNTGDFIPVSSGTAKSAATPIKAIVPAYNSLLVLKDDESFALVGSDAENFEVRKVWDDGCLSGMSVAQWRSEVLFAGRNGVYSWDGTQITDLMQSTLGIEYKAAVKNFDPTTYRMWSAVARDHYFLFIESVTPRIGLTQGKTSSIPTRWTVIINLVTKAVTLATNMDIRGALTLPSNEQQNVWLLINTSTGGAICDANAIFDASGNDAFTCAGNTIGPFFYLESKRYSLGDPLRRKMIKQIAAHYQSFGDSLDIDTVVGLGTASAGTTNAPVTVVTPAQAMIPLILSKPASTSLDYSGVAFVETSQTWTSLGREYSTWSALSGAYPDWSTINTTVWGKRRYKFLRHDNFLGFRIYQSSTANSLVQLGPWQIGFTMQAPGRI